MSLSFSPLAIICGSGRGPDKNRERVNERKEDESKQRQDRRWEQKSIKRSVKFIKTHQHMLCTVCTLHQSLHFFVFWAYTLSYHLLPLVQFPITITTTIIIIIIIIIMMIQAMRTASPTFSRVVNINIWPVSLAGARSAACWCRTVAMAQTWTPRYCSVLSEIAGLPCDYTKLYLRHRNMPCTPVPRGPLQSQL